MPKRIAIQAPAKRKKTFIAAWRIHRGLNQEQLADRLGSSKASISRIENGEQPYTQDVLEAIAEALRTDPASLLMRDPSSKEAIWSIWENAKQGERQMIVDLALTVTKKTGT